jgi:predicted nucleotidyltransferase
MRRAVECAIGENVAVKICSAEDLIIHKAVAGRPKDLDDIESIIIRMAKKLDDDYILYWLDQFAEQLEMPEIIDRFKKPWSMFNK